MSYICDAPGCSSPSRWYLPDEPGASQRYLCAGHWTELQERDDHAGRRYAPLRTATLQPLPEDRSAKLAEPV